MLKQNVKNFMATLFKELQTSLKGGRGWVWGVHTWRKWKQKSSQDSRWFLSIHLSYSTSFLPNNASESHLSAPFPSPSYRTAPLQFTGHVAEEASLTGSANGHQCNWASSFVSGDLTGHWPASRWATDARRNQKCPMKRAAQLSRDGGWGRFSYKRVLGIANFWL